MDGRMFVVFAGVWLAYRVACWIHERREQS